MTAQWRGALAFSTLLGCAAFAPVSGSALATAATIGGVALKEMDRYKYDPRLAAGTVAAGGTIGILIPPSLTMVIYGVMTERSIGKLFMAGIVPGLMVTGLFIATVVVWVRLRPEMAPRAEPLPWRERLLALRGVWEALLLFALVIGGIYTGVFAPTEAAGIGAFATLVLSWMRKRMPFPVLVESLKATAATSGMVFLIIIGSSVFSTFLAITGLTQALTGMVSGGRGSPLAVLLLILLAYSILGCLMDSLGMILLTVPVFFPVVVAAGYDPGWFGTIP